MKSIVYSILFISICSLAQSCKFCGKDSYGRFHPPISVLFDDQDGNPQISPIGDFNVLTAALYDENDNLVDTTFGVLFIEDWNENWTSDNIDYSRQYKLTLDKNQGFEEYVYLINIDYSGTVDDCNAYNINDIKFTINDSIYYSGIFDVNFTFTLKI